MKENNTRTRDRNYLKGFKNYSSAVFDYCFVFTLLLLCFCFEFNYLLFLTDFVHEPEHMFSCIPLGGELRPLYTHASLWELSSDLFIYGVVPPAKQWMPLNKSQGDQSPSPPRLL